MERVVDFYDGLADDYHCVYADWESSVRRQGEALDRLVRERLGEGPHRVLDCTCGIGTQSLGLAALGHAVVGTDASERSIERARVEARRRGLDIRFEVADVRTLSVDPGGFDVVLSADNSLPHLTHESDLRAALARMVEQLRAGGLLVASTRDYDEVVERRPVATPPVPSGRPGARRVTFQLWSWEEDGRAYGLELFVLREAPDGSWRADVHRARYRAILRAELAEALRRVGLRSVEWTMPEESGFFQPLVAGVRAA